MRQAIREVLIEKRGKVDLYQKKNVILLVFPSGKKK